MKKLLILVISVLGALSVNAQVKHVKLVRDTSEKPVFIINDQIIAGSRVLKNIPEKYFSEIRVLRTKL